MSEPIDQYRRLVESVTDYAIFGLTTDGKIDSWNPGAKATFGYEQSEVIGKSYAMIFTAEDVANGRPECELKTAREHGKASVDGWHVRKDGNRFWCTDTVQTITDPDGTISGFTKIVQDSTTGFLASESLRESEEYLRVMLEAVTEYGIFCIESDGKIRLWNSGAERIFGYTEKEALGQHFSMVYSPAAIAANVPAAEISEASASGHALDEGWHVRKDGARFYATGQMTKLATGRNGELRGFVKIAHDITARRAAEETSIRQATFDELTKLPNRRSLIEHLRRAIAITKRHPERLYALFFLDLDHFKTLNDSLGHVAADGLLIHVARTLEKCVRPEDVVGRLGGDEFTVLLTDVRSEDDVTRVSARIHAALAHPTHLDNVEVFTSASIGIALGSGNYDTADGILRDADTAMYEAKARGRSQSVVFNEAMHARAVDLLELQMDLRRALANREFFVEYQPIVGFADRRVAGFEALVRWQHPRRGVVAPLEFIAEAEHIGLLSDIDSWVMREACRQIGAWQLAAGEPRLFVTVNLSSKHFSNEALVAEVERNLADHAIDPSSLKLEITESVLMQRDDATMATIARVHALGVGISIDDFGTGYSSFSYLMNLPLHALKIDRSFVEGMTSDRRSGAIARTVVTLAHSLGLAAIAEGIENEDQHDALEVAGCEFGQGFWFSQPVLAERAAAFVGATLP